MSYEVPEEYPLQRELGRNYVIHAYQGMGAAEFPIHISVPMTVARTEGDDAGHTFIETLVPEIVDAAVETLLRRMFKVKVMSSRMTEDHEITRRELPDDD